MVHSCAFFTANWMPWLNVVWDSNPVDQTCHKPWIVMLADTLEGRRGISRIDDHSCENEPQTLQGWNKPNLVNLHQITSWSPYKIVHTRGSDMGTSDHLTCLMRNQYVGQETIVRTWHGTTDWFKIGKGVHQGYILSPWLFKLYAEYIMWNAGLDEAQAGIKIAGRSISNFRYVDDITLMAESE